VTPFYFAASEPAVTRGAVERDGEVVAPSRSGWKITAECRDDLKRDRGNFSAEKINTLWRLTGRRAASLPRSVI
jgi:hypothetical protein